MSEKKELHVETLGDGEPLLLLHGFTGCGTDWQHLITEPPAGFRLITPDLPGHGSSAPIESFSFRRCAELISDLLDGLEIGRFKAIGLSGGAQVLLHLATQKPERVDSMVLVSTAHYFPQQARELMSLMGVEGRSEAEWQEMRGRHKLGDDQIRDLWQIGHDMKDSFDDVNFTPAYLSQITARTLIVHGDRDPLYPPAMALELFSSIPEAQLWMVPGGGHLPIFGDGAEEFMDTAIRFITE